MTEFIQVLITTDREDDAQRIARELVARRLAGCVHVLGPIQSTYHWEGKIESAEEWRLEIKTRRDHFGELEKAIRQLHTYDVPQILALEIVEGSQPYLDWLRRETELDGATDRRED